MTRTSLLGVASLCSVFISFVSHVLLSITKAAYSLSFLCFSIFRGGGSGRGDK